MPQVEASQKIPELVPWCSISFFTKIIKDKVAWDNKPQVSLAPWIISMTDTELLLAALAYSLWLPGKIFPQKKGALRWGRTELCIWMTTSRPADGRTPAYFQLRTAGVKQLTMGTPDGLFDLCLLLLGMFSNRTTLSKSFHLLTLE